MNGVQYMQFYIFLKKIEKHFNKVLKEKDMQVDNLQKQFDDLKSEQSKHQSDQIPAKKVTNLIFKCKMCDFQTNSKQGLKKIWKEST